MPSLSQLITASEMLNVGFRPRIITAETGLSLKQLKKISQELDKFDVFLFHSKPGKVPSGLTIVKNIQSKMHASFVMRIYCLVGGAVVDNTVDCKSLCIANLMYQSLLCEMDSNLILDINDLWYLAQEIRNKQAVIELCEHCGLEFFYSIHQRMNSACPFCENLRFFRNQPDRNRTLSGEHSSTGCRKKSSLFHIR